MELVKIRHRANHGVAEVDELLAAKLESSGTWERADAAPAPAPRRRRAAREE
ncbi:DUF7302 family protein [Prescottella equi]